MLEYAYLKSARVLYDAVLELEFEDGTVANVDFSYFPPREGVFKRLDDPAYLKDFSVDHGVLSWGAGELDIAPETLYAHATGRPYPHWMRVEDTALEVHEDPPETAGRE